MRLSGKTFTLKYKLKGAWPAHFFIFHLSCTVSPANNGALHYITHPLCIHANESDIQSSSSAPFILIIIGGTIPLKIQVGQKKKRKKKKKRMGPYLPQHFTSICDTINQFGPSPPLFWCLVTIATH